MKTDRRTAMEKGESFPLLKLIFRSRPLFLNDFEFRPVKSEEEFKAASHLVYQEYRKKDYIPANDQELYLFKQQLLKQTTVFVALYKKTQVVATISMVEDSEYGLPMDNIYPEEIRGLRKEGHHLVEATRFTVSPRIELSDGISVSTSQKILIILTLFRTVFDYLRANTNVDELVGNWNPSHDILYKFMQMEPLGELKSNTNVNGSPAVARHLNIPRAVEKAETVASLEFLFGSICPL